MKNIKINFEKLIWFLVLVLTSYCLFLTYFNPLQYQDSVWRMLIGFSYTFFIPGLVLSSMFNTRYSSIYNVISISFLFSGIIYVIMLAFILLFHFKIDVCVAGSYFFSILGIVFHLFKKSYNHFKFFPADIESRLKIWFIFYFIIIVILCVGCYRWGDPLAEEHIQHLAYVRYYFELPYNRPYLTLMPYGTPANFVYYWEYLLAIVSKASSVDPIYVFFRARFIIPIVGFSAFYSLINSVFTNQDKKVFYIFMCAVFLCLGDFMYLDSYLDWIGESTRGVMSFAGFSAHMDPAVAIILPMTIASFVNLIQKRDLINLIASLTSLVISFLWHPREYFIAECYLVILVISLYAYFKKVDKEILKNIKWSFVVVVVVNLLFLALHFLTQDPIAKKYQNYNEFSFKSVVLHEMSLNWFTDLFSASSLFFYYSEAHFRFWMLFFGLSLVVLFLLGNKSDKSLAVFSFILWFILVSWKFSYNVVNLMTYSEFFMGNVFFLYLVILISVPCSILLIYEHLFERSNIVLNRKIIYTLMFFLFAILLRFYWNIGYPHFMKISYVITTIVVFLFLAVIFDFKKINKKSTYDKIEIASIFKYNLFFIIFFTPLLEKNFITKFNNLVNLNRKISFHTEGNRFGISTELISYLKSMPPQNIFFNNPIGKYSIQIYVPQYTFTEVPYCSFKDTEAVQSARADTYPLFNSSTKKYEFKHDEILNYIKEIGANYIIIEPEYYDSSKEYFLSKKDNYEITFDSVEKKELIVRMR